MLFPRFLTIGGGLVSTSCCFFRLTVNNLYEKNEKYQARNTCRMYVRVMGVRETQCEYSDAAGGVEPGAVCRRTLEESAGRCGVFVCYVVGYCLYR